MESNIFNELNEKYREFKTNLKGGVGEFAAALALKYDVSEKIHIIRDICCVMQELQRLDIWKRKQQNVDADVCKRTEISVF